LHNQRLIEGRTSSDDEKSNGLIERGLTNLQGQLALPVRCRLYQRTRIGCPFLFF